MSIVVDASVALKWFFPESDSPKAEELLGGHNVLAAPTLMISEVCNAVWKRLRRGETTVHHADRVPDRIGTVGMILISDETLAAAAMQIARRLDHPVLLSRFSRAAGCADGHRRPPADRAPPRQRLGRSRPGAGGLRRGGTMTDRRLIEE